MSDSSYKLHFSFSFAPPPPCQFSVSSSRNSNVWPELPFLKWLVLSREWFFNSDSAKRNNRAKVSTVTGNLRFSYKIKRLFSTPIFDWHVFVLCSFAGSSFPFFTILAVKFNGRIPFRIQFSTWRGSSPSIWRIFMVALKSGQSFRVQKKLWNYLSLKTTFIWDVQTKIFCEFCENTHFMIDLYVFVMRHVLLVIYKSLIITLFLRHLATMKQKISNLIWF